MDGTSETLELSATIIGVSVALRVIGRADCLIA